jgi:hypothetical protein
VARKEVVMFVVNTDKTIFVTRGDTGTINFSASVSDTEKFTFEPGDVIRFKVFKKKQHEAVVLQKDVLIDTATTKTTIELSSSDTKIGSIINKPVDYWYEIEINPDTGAAMTPIGYDTEGPKIFRLFPEGGDAE